MSLIAGRYDNIDSWVDVLIIVVIVIVVMAIWIWADGWWNRRKARTG